MNLVKINNQPLTMGTRDIANMLEKNHSDVKRSAKRLSDAGILTQPLAESDYEHRGNTYKEYRLEKRDCYILVAQLSPEFTAAIVDRWQELENESKPQLPQTFAEALQLAADQAKLLELQAPKVAFVENLVERDTLMTATQVAQKHEKSAIWLNKILSELNVYSKAVKRGKVFKQWFVDKGYGKMKQNELGYSQALFTPAGEVWISEKLYTEGIL